MRFPCPGERLLGGGVLVLGEWPPLGGVRLLNLVIGDLGERDLLRGDKDLRGVNDLRGLGERDRGADSLLCGAGDLS